MCILYMCVICMYMSMGVHMHVCICIHDYVCIFVISKYFKLEYFIINDCLSLNGLKL